MRDRIASVVTIEAAKPERLRKRVTSPAAKMTPHDAPKEKVIMPGNYRHCAHPRLYGEPRIFG